MTDKPAPGWAGRAEQWFARVTADGTRAGRVLLWLGHYQVHLLILFAVAGIAYDASGDNFWLGIVSTATITLWVAAFLASFAVHQWRLCERCIAEAPALNPQGA